MNRQIFQLPEDASPQARNAFRVIAVFLGAVLVVTSYVVFQAIQTQAWQLWVEAVSVGILIAFELAALSLARRGRHELGVWLTFAPWLVVLIVTSAMIAGVGLMLLISAVAIISLAAGQTLSPRNATALTILGVAMGVMALLVDLFIQTPRIALPGFQNVIVGLMVVLLALFGYVTLRQFRDYSLRTKLIVVAVATVLAAVSAQALITVRSISTALQNNQDEVLLAAANEAAANMDDHLNAELLSVRSAAQITDFGKFLETAASLRDERLVQETTSSLQSLLQRDPVYIKSFALLNKWGLDELDTNANALGSRHNNNDYYKQIMEKGLPYASPVKFLPGGEAELYFAAPIYSQGGQITGILLATYDAKILQKWLVQTNGLTGPQSFPILLDENHMRLAHGTVPSLIFKSVVPLDAVKLAELQAANRLPNLPADQLSTNLPDFQNALANVDSNPHFTTKLVATGSETDSGAAVHMKIQPWLVAYFEPTSAYLAPVQTQTNNAILFAIGISLFMALVGAGVAQVLSAPLVRLTAVADQVAAGDLNAQAKVESSDETGKLAASFNAMTSQLRDLIDSLEARVEARTKDLATVAEVGTATATILEVSKLLQEVVDLSKERFNLYHSHIYLLDEAGKNLVLASGAGEPGRQMVKEGRSIPLDREQSLVARAARERKGVTVNDVTQAPDFLPNPLLPNTRSELAVPMIVGGNVIGVFDVQSDQIGRFADSDINIQTTLAAQVATSIQNVRSFEQSKKRADFESLVSSIGQKIQRATTVDDTLQTAIREMGLALGASRVTASIQARQTDGDA